MGPDLLVARGHPPGENPSCYLTYEDGPLTRVIEVASESTRAQERAKRDGIYAAQLAVPEPLFIDGERQVLELSALVEGRYERVAPDEEGRLWSRELGIGFVWQEDGRLVRVFAADGRQVLTPEEEAARRRQAEERAEREARRAQRETRRATAAARRADEEVRRRAEVEARAEALAAELERLRRAVEGDSSTPG